MKPAVCVLIQNPENPTQYLAISRRNDTSQWGLPGGKVDPGESNVEAVVRETYEEIGVQLDPLCLEPLFSDACPGKGPDDTYWVTTYLWTSPNQFPGLDTCNPEQGLSLTWACPQFLSATKSSPFARYNQGVFLALQRYGAVAGTAT
jgi:8-oxo-dGTP pyrophosphatase MutT (NUDIX family)